ncbi:MAG TPA: histidine phosphatase family protein [Candidatus Paceibacterota bacterium]|nr:histidine phosphatase family protein [Candidatus Paceibacterota bacterium]
MAINITYFAHGTSTDNEKGISSGWLDAELSKRGVMQSVELRDQLNGYSSLVVEPMLEKAITERFPNGECLEDVKARIEDFLRFLKAEHEGKNVALVAHRAPQLALEVLLNRKTWEEASAEGWRKIGAWKPGWDYLLE